MKEVPVLLTVFNRVDLVNEMLVALQQMQPRLLFIAADGPRSGNSLDEEYCAQVRKTLKNISWPCEVEFWFQDDNLGCGNHISGAITKVFQHFDRIIVLEDDCIPAPSFLPFCSELLEYFCADERISMVCGSLPLDFQDNPYSYFFSRSYSCWGWATWKRAWREFDFNLTSWPTLRNSKLIRSRFISEYDYKMWETMLQKVYESEKRAWAAQWGFACRKSGGLAAFSHRNLIANRGINHNLSTHSGAKNLSTIWGRTPQDIKFPIKHPPFILPDIQKEMAVRKAISGANNRLPQLRQKIKSFPPLIREIRSVVKKYWDIY